MLLMFFWDRVENFAKSMSLYIKFTSIGRTDTLSGEQNIFFSLKGGFLFICGGRIGAFKQRPFPDPDSSLCYEFS
jgi:hypothetical protein